MCITNLNILLIDFFFFFVRSVDLRRPDPGGADGGRGHGSDPGSGGRPGGKRQDAAAARSLAAQHQQQERVSSADR